MQCEASSSSGACGRSYAPTNRRDNDDNDDDDDDAAATAAGNPNQGTGSTDEWQELSNHHCVSRPRRRIEHEEGSEDLEYPLAWLPAGHTEQCPRPQPPPAIAREISRSRFPRRATVLAIPMEHQDHDPHGPRSSAPAIVRQRTVSFDAAQPHPGQLSSNRFLHDYPSVGGHHQGSNVYADPHSGTSRHIRTTPVMSERRRPQRRASAETDAVSGRQRGQWSSASLAHPSLLAGLEGLVKQGWYWGPVSRVEAEEILEGLADGTFLVRDSTDDRYLHSLSFQAGGRTRHMRIEHFRGAIGFSESRLEQSRTVVSLIEMAVAKSQKGTFCTLRNTSANPARLLHAHSRFRVMRSLQQQCRVVIRQATRYDLIGELPVPKMIQSYLRESPFSVS